MVEGWGCDSIRAGSGQVKGTELGSPGCPVLWGFRGLPSFESSHRDDQGHQICSAVGMLGTEAVMDALRAPVQYGRSVCVSSNTDNAGPVSLLLVCLVCPLLDHEALEGIGF